MKNVSKKIDINDYLSLPYTIEVIPEKDGGYFVKVKELTGCMTEADTWEEIEDMIKDAMREWIKTALENNMEIPLPEKVNTV